MTECCGGPWSLGVVNDRGIKDRPNNVGLFSVCHSVTHYTLIKYLRTKSLLGVCDHGSTTSLSAGFYLKYLRIPYWITRFLVWRTFAHIRSRQWCSYISSYALLSFFFFFGGGSCPFRTKVIIALHKFLAFVARSFETILNPSAIPFWRHFTQTR